MKFGLDIDVLLRMNSNNIGDPPFSNWSITKYLQK